MTKYYPTKKKIVNKSIWAFYEGEDCIAIGTFEELCEKLNYKLDTLYYYSSNSYKKRLKKFKKKNKKYLILVEKVKGRPIDYAKINKKKEIEI